ncbi:MAG: aldo/keto reductase [Balneola sp.]|jgi:predicted oxidoreductase
MRSQRIQLAKNLSLSRVVHGEMRLLEWNLSNQELLGFIQRCIEIGVTTFDHADIYGDYGCEEKFGYALNLDTSIRNNIEIITKCGIKKISDKFPSRVIGHYDYSYSHIVESAETSLKNLNTNYIDVFLLHRPAPFFNPEEVAKAFNELHQSGKVLHFGVSNFTPIQFLSLQAHLDQKLVTNQVEISPYNLEHFDNGNIDFFLKEGIKPMAWSPLAGGSLFNPQDEKAHRLVSTLKEIAEELNLEHIDSVIYAWLLNHPAQILPIVGSGKFERIKTAVDALQIEMSLEQWYKIWVASKGHRVP